MKTYKPIFIQPITHQRLFHYKISKGCKSIDALLTMMLRDMDTQEQSNPYSLLYNKEGSKELTNG